MLISFIIFFLCMSHKAKGWDVHSTEAETRYGSDLQSTDDQNPCSQSARSNPAAADPSV